MKRNALYVFGGSVLCCVACSDSGHTGSEDTASETATEVDTENRIPAGMGRIEGVVTDGDGIALSGAAVFIGGESVTTEFDGRFQLDVEPGAAVLGFSKNGYAETALPVVITEGAATPVQEGMMKRSPAVTFNIDDGGTAGGEARVELEPGSLVTEGGTAATGEIQVSITPVDVTGDLTAAPGDFSAKTAAGNETGLETLGMAEFYFEDGDGNRLQVAEGKTVSVELDLPAGVTAEVGDIIPAWTFDTETGKWLEEGEGEVVENDDGLLMWRVEVAHFSWWNCDKPIEEKDCVSGAITDCNGNPVRGASIKARGLDYQGESSAFGDGEGTYCVDIKRGAEANLIVVGNVGGKTVGRSVTVTGADVGASCEEGGCTEQNIELPCDPAESDLDCSESPLFPCGGCLSGRVVNPDGDALDNASIAMEDPVSGFRTSAMSDGDGAFCLAAPVGASVELKVNAAGFPPYAMSVADVAEGQCPDCQDIGDVTVVDRVQGDTVYDTCNISDIEIAATDLGNAPQDMASFPHVGMMLLGDGAGGDLSGYLWLTNADDPDNADGTTGIVLSVTIPANGSAGDSAVLDGFAVYNAGGIVGVNSEYFTVSSSVITWNEDITGAAQTLTGSVEFALSTVCGMSLNTIVYQGTFTTEVMDIMTYLSIPECADFFSTAFASIYLGDSFGALSFDVGGVANSATGASVMYSAASDTLSISGSNDVVSFILSQSAPVFGSQDISSAYLAADTCSYGGDEIPELVIETNDADDFANAFSGTFSATLPPLTTDCTDPVSVSGSFTAAICSE